ncbi:hypothetical protein HCB37_04335 [Listeria booriae]|uniref:hypothetical protein n=1 Tax=Listeria booriae TaxID=1552123 RepID=UPI001627EF19|nr:hypothetical protein [Listeria booriae]MBC2263741.1 hypothetical protein [Listeria booriae]
MNELTNDAKFLLTSMYEVYIKRRNAGALKEEAVLFETVSGIQEEIMPEWHIEDVEFTCFELRKHGYVKGELLDNTIYFVSLTTEAIATLELDFRDKADAVLEYAAKIKSAIPFL